MNFDPAACQPARPNWIGLIMSAFVSDSMPWALQPIGSVLDRSRIHRCDWDQAAVVAYHQTSTARASSYGWLPAQAALIR